MNTKPQVLILSANAKVPLIRAFQSAGAVVHAADQNALRAALHLADRTVVFPRSDTKVYADQLLSYCRELQIDLVVPTRDGDLLPLSSLEPALRELGTVCLLPARASIETCLDKIAFHRFCQQHNFPVPRQFAAGMKGPLFLRHRHGTGGMAAFKVDGTTDPMFRDDPNWLAQEFIDAPEYSVDLLSDFSGHPMQAVARRRLLVRAGEAQISTVEDQPILTDLAKTLGNNLKLVGHTVIQMFLHPRSGPLLIEANLRFGGASSLSIEAGLNSPERIIALLNGAEDSYHNADIHFGMTLLRYPNDLFVLPEEAPAEPPS